ncbi:patatin-like phospholipase family protein [Saccharicrinis sp. FJH2]|uniref:patatin-like phospholipase family protein n=1 Tax=Saccharicrinis sp. FJH65 TaxID=3344659 RepID=UPI0035F49D15
MEKNIALVLSGGGARGISHIGAIEVLEKEGFKIASVTGTSMGALVGGIYALGKLNEFKEWIITLDKLKIFSLIDFTLSSQGLVKGDKLLNKMKDFIPDANIEDLKIHYAAVATDIIKKREVVFTKGSVYDAIRASIAIPTVFTPVKNDGSLLVDGGLLNNLPINRAKRTNGDLLVAVNVNASIPVYRPRMTQEESALQESVYLKKVKGFNAHLKKIRQQNHHETMGYFDLISKTIGIMLNHNVETSLERHPVDVLINISRDTCGTYDFFKAEELIEIGKHAAYESIKDLKAIKKNSY